jgi:branched-chain amino acid transport system permease protein
MNYLVHLLTIFAMYACILISTSLLAGMTNTLSLSQAAFLGIGAYLGVWLYSTLGIPFYITLILVFFMVGSAGFLMSLLSKRLKGDNFILATIGFQALVFSFLYNCVSITKGPLGIFGISLPNIFTRSVSGSLYSALLISVLIAIIACFFCLEIIKSPFGRLLKGIREDETTVITLGRNPFTSKAIISFLSSGLIAMTGVFYAGYIGYIDPTVFNLDFSIFILIAAIIGGTGNLKGPIAGSLFIVFIPEMLRTIGFPDAQAANIRQIFYGLIIIVLMQLRPQGIAGEKSF